MSNVNAAADGPPVAGHVGLHEQIAVLRKKLLDLTGRNPLLAFNHAGRSRMFIRAIDELPDQLYQRLDGDKFLRFKGLGVRDDEPADEKNIEFQRALEAARIEDPDYVDTLQRAGHDPGGRVVERLERELRDRLRVKLGMLPRTLGRSASSHEEVARRRGLNPAFDLPSVSVNERKHQDDRIQTLLFDDELDPRLSAIAARVRTSLDETGVNPLFCVFGFLEWFDSDSSEKPLHAPLLLLPLEISREVNRGQREYRIRSSGEDLTINVALAERLKRDFDLELPPIEEQDTPESYFSQVQRIIERKKGWKVRRWITFGLFSFAKIAMYRDLAPERWQAAGGLDQNPELVRIICGSGADAQGPEPSAQVSSRDEDQESADLDRDEMNIPLITDADSSQLDVIRSILGGQSTVIEGPPGTGKSQTITNMIAAAMNAGKSVLFIAEKMAALNVVQKRLADAGLGPFCLELHSTKAGRRETYDAIGRRLQMARPARVDGEFDAVRRELKQCRAEFASVVEALGQPAGNLPGTVQELLWRVQKLRGRVTEWATEFEDVWLTAAADWTGTEIGRATETAQLFAKNRQDIIDAYGSLRSCPWYGLDRVELDILAQETIRTRVRSLGAAAGRALDRAEKIHGLTGWMPSQIDDLELNEVIAPETLADEVLIARLRSSDTRAVAERFVADSQEFADLRQRLGQRFSGPPPRTGENIRRAAEASSGLFDRTCCIGELAGRAESFAARARQLGAATEILKRIRSLLSPIELPEDHVTDRALIAVVELASAADSEIRRERSQEYTADGTLPVLEKARAERDSLLLQRKDLSIHFVLEDIPDVSVLRECARSVRSAPFIPLFSRAYRAAKRTWRTICRAPRRSSRAAVAADLDSLSSWHEAESAFEQNEEYIRTLGEKFRGLSSPFETALKVAKWSREVRTRLLGLGPAGLALQEFLFRSPNESLEALGAVASDVGFQKLSEFVSPASASIAKLAADMQQRAERASAAAELCESAGILGKVPIGELNGIAADLDRGLLLARQIGDSREIATLLGDSFHGTETNTGPLRASIDYVRKVLSSGLPEPIQRWLLEQNVRSRSAQLAALAPDAKKARAELIAEVGALEQSAGRHVSDWVRCPNIGAIAPSDLLRLTERALGDESGLLRLVRNAQLLQDLDRFGLGKVALAFCERGSPLDRLADLCSYVIYKSFAKTLLARSNALIRFSADRYEALRSRFRDLDVQLHSLRRKKIVNELLSRRPPVGSDRGRRDEWTELKLIQHVTSLQRPRTSIRHFLQQAGRAVQQLMPCFMMSPLSVAQYLPAGLRFDLVVMDEASQLRPEDAAGSIARAKQVVIVGDPKQLPPTRFFMDGSVELDEEDEGTIADEESILDAAGQVLHPMKRLCWHYRSRHGSLIAFSNHEFYDDRLVVFPSPKEQHPEAGVRYIFVDGGCYEPKVSVNRPEAERILEAVLEHARRNPQRSIGVVALNIKQAELLRTRLEALQEQEPEFLAFCDRWKHTLEPFFVKNLENVQGDERDVILISTVYGKDATGSMFQRFGPINQAGGHRRLNVLFTRAKYQTVVFSSMTPADIRVDEKSSRGVRVLHGYLKYAKEGRFAPSITGAASESEFESSVLNLIQEAGFEGVPQVGVSGYRVDIAVRNPQEPGEFLLGVECDGATYHSSKSARDRDRLRQQVLENLGWRIHRIWSLEWYRDPKGEAQRLVRAIREAAAAQIR